MYGEIGNNCTGGKGIMTQAQCPRCKKIMIQDWDKFLEESKEKYIQCPYCNYHIVNLKFKEIELK